MSTELLSIFQGEIDRKYVPYSGKNKRKIGKYTFNLVGTYLYENTANLLAKQMAIDGETAVRVIGIKGGYALFVRGKGRNRY